LAQNQSGEEKQLVLDACRPARNPVVLTELPRIFHTQCTSINQ